MQPDKKPTFQAEERPRSKGYGLVGYKIRWDCVDCGWRAGRPYERRLLDKPCIKCGGKMTPYPGTHLMFACDDFSFAPIQKALAKRGIERENIYSAAEATGLSREDLIKYFSGEKSLTWWRADRVATKLGYHPSAFWPEWFDLAPGQTTERFDGWCEKFLAERREEPMAAYERIRDSRFMERAAELVEESERVHQELLTAMTNMQDEPLDKSEWSERDEEVA